MTERARDPGELLLPRIARGDPQAVGLCMERYGSLVWSLARRLRCDPSDAEDAVQEIFIEIWKSAARYDPERSAEATFISTIARRRIIDRNRARGRQAPTEIVHEDSAQVDDEVLGRLEISEEAERAAQAIETLRPDQQRVLRLSVVQGLSHSEIALETGLPLGTVKSHVRRGLERVGHLLRAGTAREAREVTS